MEPVNPGCILKAVKLWGRLCSAARSPIGRARRVGEAGDTRFYTASHVD